MSIIEIGKVKEILRTNYITGNVDDFELSCETEEEFTNRVAQQICQLFPKSPDNPDGYEPKAILDKGMGKIILKPKPDEKDQWARAQYAYETGHPERELEVIARCLGVDVDVIRDKHSTALFDELLEAVKAKGMVVK